MSCFQEKETKITLAVEDLALGVQNLWEALSHLDARVIVTVQNQISIRLIQIAYFWPHFDEKVLSEHFLGNRMVSKAWDWVMGSRSTIIFEKPLLYGFQSHCFKEFWVKDVFDSC